MVKVSELIKILHEYPDDWLETELQPHLLKPESISFDKTVAVNREQEVIKSNYWDQLRKLYLQQIHNSPYLVVVNMKQAIDQVTQMTANQPKINVIHVRILEPITE